MLSYVVLSIIIFIKSTCMSYCQGGKVMKWKDKCFDALDEAGMFENSGHRTRFKELTDCYCNYPFFTRGLCKCMYLSAWDEEHFCILLGTLADMTAGREQDTDEMRSKGECIAEEQGSDEYYAYELSVSFLDGRHFHLDDSVELSPEMRHIISRALKAAEIIDQV